MHDATQSGTQAVIRARMDRFDLMTRVLGCESDLAREKLTGLDDRTIRRARTGYVSGVFVAKALTSLRAYERELAARNLRPTFDELFEVLVVAVEDAAEETVQ